MSKVLVLYYSSYGHVLTMAEAVAEGARRTGATVDLKRVPGQMTLDEIVGSSPYRATTIASGQGERQPSKIELEGARFQSRLIAETANKLFG